MSRTPERPHKPDPHRTAGPSAAARSASNPSSSINSAVASGVIAFLLSEKEERAQDLLMTRILRTRNILLSGEVNKALADFSSRGWIRLEQRSVVLLDPERQHVPHRHHDGHLHRH